MNNISFNLINEKPQLLNTVFLIDDYKKLDKNIFSERELDFIEHRIENGDSFIPLNYFYHWNYIVITRKADTDCESQELMRKSVKQLIDKIELNDLGFINLIDLVEKKDIVSAFIEGFVLYSYSFNAYKSNIKKKRFGYKINVFSKVVNEDDIEKWESIMDIVGRVRDMVNEPASKMTITKFSDTIMEMAHETGLHVVLHRQADLERMRMGGLLAVNKASKESAVLIQLEWKHPKAKEKKPYVFVGKGVVYDSGGLSLKPTANSMDFMKSDMAGGAAVCGLMSAISRNSVPIHAIGLIPITDNRIGVDAYAPGDVISMHNGLNVEVMNTDAEGRLILADAISYANEFDPKLIMSVATLTGSAIKAIGSIGAVVMGNAEKFYFDKIESAGNKTYERVAQFPFWNEYNEMLKSDIADLKNIGGSEAGAITAGKFLEHFTKSSFVHLDIAGPAFLHKANKYYRSGATGYGVRLLFEFVQQLIK